MKNSSIPRQNDSSNKESVLGSGGLLLGRVIFRVKKPYFEKIKSGEKTKEIRTNTAYWRRLLLDVCPQVAIFICGHQVHKRLITQIHLGKPENALRRPLTLEELTMIDLGPAIIVSLGPEVA